MKIVAVPLSLTILILLSAPTNSVPRWDQSVAIEGITFFRDHRNPRLYLYSPAPLDLFYNSDGTPGISLSLVNYQGTAKRDDAGRTIQRGVLSVRLAPLQSYSARVMRAERELRRRFGHVSVRPIVPETSSLKFTLEEVLGDGGLNLDATFARAEEEDRPDTDATNYWGPAPTVTLPLSPDDAVIVKDGLRNANLLAAITFDFQSTGIEPGVQGGGFVEEGRTIQADSIPLYVADEHWDKVYHYVDLNELAPPDHPLLSVICFDFAWGREDLELKAVDIRARSPGVGWVYARAEFSLTAPEISSVEIRFRHAVQMDQPPEYRISTLTVDGNEVQSEWNTAASWEWLDVSEEPEPTDAMHSGGG